MKRFLFAFISLTIFLPSLSLQHAEETPRVDWTFDESYSGPHENSFNKLRYEVPALMRQTMIDLAVRCGLNFEEGWKCPLVVRFSDEAPFGVENILAYVQIGTDQEGHLRQQLVVNLKAYDRENFSFSKVFAHELVHAMLNDSLGVNSTKLPIWFHEGLAVYGANQGEQLKEAYTSRMMDMNPHALLTGLEGPHGGSDYLEDYLAFKYIHDVHGVNSLRNFIQAVIMRGGDIPGAIEATCLESWDEFQAHARAFAEEELTQAARSHHGGRAVKPY